MKFQQHYLSDKNNYKRCPLNVNIACNSHCAWFDHEVQDCRQIGMMWKIKDDLQEINKTISEGFEFLGGLKNGKRQFKF